MSQLRPLSLALCLLSLCGLFACTNNADTRLKPPPDGEDVPSWPPAKAAAGELTKPAAAQQALAVVAATPSGQVSDAGAISVVFNQEMAATGFGVPATTGPFEIKPAVEGTFSWWGGRTAVFRPAKKLPPATSFEVRVPAGLKAASGAALATDHLFHFETPGLAVSEAYSAGVFGPTSSLRLAFTLPVSAAEVQRAVRLVSKRGEQAALTVERTHVEGAFNLKPVKPLEMGQEYELVVDASIKGPGEAVLGKTWRQSFRTHDRLAVNYIGCGDEERCAPGASLQVSFNNPVHAPDVMRCVKVAPKTAVTLSYGYDTEVYVRLPEAQPGSRYEVSVAGDCMDALGTKLSAASKRAVVITDMPPTLSMERGLVTLERPGKGEDNVFPVASVNMGALRVKLRRVEEQELPALIRRLTQWNAAGTFDATFAPQVERTLAATKVRNKPAAQGVDLGGVLGATGVGLVYLEVAQAGAPAAPAAPANARRGQDWALVAVTDLAITTKASAGALEVWVTRLSDGSPVEGATVRLWKESGEEVSSTRTDAAGRARAAGYEEESPTYRLVTAELAGDLAYQDMQDWQTQVALYNYDLPIAWGSRGAELVGEVFTERGVYRAGERVHLKGFVRMSQADGLALPKAREVTVTVTDPRGKVVKAERVPRSGLGGFALEVALEERSPLGDWSVTAQVEDAGEAQIYGAFRVEAYRTPRFEVKVKPGADALTAGVAGSAVVEGRYLYGAPMKGAKLTYSALVRSGRFEPTQWDGFHFGALPYDWWAEEQGWGSGEQVLSSGEAQLDERGEWPVSVMVPASAEQTGPREVVIEAQVQDVDRQTIGATRALTVHPGSLYVGVRRPGFMVEAGEAFEAGLVVVDPAGEARGGQAIAAKLKRRTWTSTLKRGVDGGATWMSEAQDVEAGACAARSSDREVTCRLTAKEPGYYIIEAEVKDGAGRRMVSQVAVWAWGAGEGRYWRMSEDEQLRLVLDKARYKAGETARVLIQSPYVPARALVTVERQGVLYEQQVAITQAAQTVEVPVEARFMPNAFVSVVLVRGRAEAAKKLEVDVGKPAYKVGYAKLVLDTSAQRLDVAVRAGQERYEPGAEVVAEVELRDAAGAPVSGEVTFMAVDEGVLSLTGYKTPDVLRALYREQALAVITREGRRRLVSRAEMKRLAGDKGDEGGDGLAGMNYRANFATTAAYMPLVLVDASGRAQVRFKLPENLTTFRLMAVAVGDGHHFGSGESRIVVTKPLLVRPALPRFASTGDKLKLRAVVQATDGAGGPAEVSVSVSGPVRLVGESRATVTLAPGQAQEVGFEAEVGEPGEAEVRFTVKGAAGARDGEVAKLPVRYPAPEQSVMMSGQLTMQSPGLWRKLLLPREASQSVGELEVELSSSVYGELLPGLSALIGYPYGCAEQTTGRTLPLVMLAQTLSSWETPGLEAGRAKVYAQAGIERLLSMQVADGGIGYWPGAELSHPWASIYGGLAVVRGEQRGYKVPAEQRDMLLEYLRRVLRGQVIAERWWDAEAMAASSVFAAWVLTEAGQGEPSYHEHLYNTRAALPAWGKALLAMAIHRQRQGGALTDRGATMVDVLMEELWASGTITERTASIAGEADSGRYWMLMDSPVRANAIALMAMLRIRPHDARVGQLAAWLLEARVGGAWLSTQEDAFAVMALAEYLQTVEQEAPAYDVVVGLGDKVLATQTMRGRDMKIKRVRVPMRELVGAEGELLTVTRQGEGGPLYYTVRLRYAERGGQQEAHEGMSVKREYLHAEGDRAGEPVEVASAGQLVLVRLTVVAPVARRYVVVEDPLPAGFEPVSLSFATVLDSQRQVVARAAGELDEGDYSWWWRPKFDHVEQRDDRVLLFADNMEPAVYVHTYLARATTPGTFAAPGARASEMYAPAVYGAGASRVVEVR